MKLAKYKDTITSIPINDELGRLGVTKFVKQGDLVQIVIDRHKVVSFNIHRKDFQQTINRFRESALNGTAGLSRDIVKDMELLLVHPDNDYVKYLQSNGNGKIQYCKFCGQLIIVECLEFVKVLNANDMFNWKRITTKGCVAWDYFEPWKQHTPKHKEEWGV